MNNEIKEILEELRKTADNTIFVVCSSQEELDKMPRYTANFMSINDRKAKLLLDYITNLQQENERLKLELSGYREAILRNDDLLGLQDYKSRCEKAIGYIKENSQMTDLNIYGIENVLSFRGNVDNLLNILQNGSDKSE